jgi:hypothetical protein
MATKKAQKKATSSRKQAKAADQRAESIRGIGANVSEVIKQAALILDEELAAGIVTARQMQQRFEQERRVDPADFKDALQRFQRDGHEVINVLGDQVAELRSDENGERVKRLVENSHDALDMLVEFAKLGADVVNQLVHANLRNKDDAGRP